MTQNIQVVPDDGTAQLITHSELLGYSFWIDEDAVFMSAPSYACLLYTSDAADE